MIMKYTLKHLQELIVKDLIDMGIITTDVHEWINLMHVIQKRSIEEDQEQRIKRMLHAAPSTTYIEVIMKVSDINEYTGQNQC